jgi:peptide-N4-(N-acetyl-beta-glucosaminyl)asparagine amidase
LLRIFGSFDGSDDAATEPGNAAVASSIDPILDFNGFDSTAGLTLVGRAKVIEGVVSLTRKEPGNSSGAVWSGDRVLVANGFESLFVFEIDHVSWFSIGDGFAFVIQNAGAGVVGDVASGNGYKGIPNSLAIEFDTVNHDYEGDPVTVMPDASTPDLLANHVAIHTMGTEPNTAHARAKLAHAALDPVRIYDRQPHLGLIRYVPGTLSVFVDNLEDPVLEVPLDLDALLTLNGGRAFVGFTASTEGLYADHRIHSWAYASPCLFEGCQDQ